MAPPLIQLSDIALTFGGTPLLDGAELAVSAGERVCLVGRNGSGKSTLLQDRRRADRARPRRALRAAGRHHPLSAAGAGPLRLRHDARLRRGRPRPDRRSASGALSAGAARPDRRRGPRAPVGRRGCAARRWRACWRRRPTSCCSTSRPTISTCRPSNGWSASSPASARALVLISHDRRFLENLSRTHGVARSRPRRGASSIGFARLRGLARRAARRGGGRPAQARPQDRRRGALGALRRHRAAQAQRAAHGQPAGAAPERGATIAAPPARPSIAAGEAEPSGALVIEAKGIAKAFGDRPIVRDFSMRIMRGDRIGIVGPNGSGKTTLVNLLTGALAPDSGDGPARRQPARWRRSTRAAKASIPTGRCSEALTGGRGDTVTVGGQTKHVVGYMKDFLFSPRAGAHAAARAVGRRARPPDAGARAGQALQPAGARRADQRSRPRDARRAGGDARRLCRHRHPDQPRPRLPRPRRSTR